MHPSAQQHLVRIGGRRGGDAAPSTTTTASPIASAGTSTALLAEAATHIHWVEMGPGSGDGSDASDASDVPLVLLHGISDCHRTWRKVAPRLARRRRVLMPDLGGHGLSGRPDASYALAWHAQVIGEWLALLGLDEVDVAGHSYGGGVAQWLLLEHRARVRRIVLVAPGGLGRDVTFALRLCAASTLVERIGQPFMSAGTRIAMRLAGSGFSHDDIDHLSWMNAMPGTARAFARTVSDVIDWRGQRRHFSHRAHEVAELPPMAVFWGDRDRIIPVRHLSDFTHALDRVESVCFENTGHFPHYERAEEFCDRLEAFLDAEHVPSPRLRASFPARKSAIASHIARAEGRVRATVAAHRDSVARRVVATVRSLRKMWTDLVSASWRRLRPAIP